MNNNAQQLKGRDIYSVQKNGFTHFSQSEFLTNLYLPIIGANAASLYLKLVFQPENKSFVHNDLIDTTQMGLIQIEDARHKLEGIGLIDTFVKNIDGEDVFIYSLNLPRNAKEFFGSQTLKDMLWHYAGEQAYLNLNNLYNTTISGVNVSKKITEEFNLGQNSSRNDNDDFETFSIQLSKLGFVAKEVNKHRNLFNDLRNLYQVDDQEMIRIFSEAKSVETGIIDEKLALRLARPKTQQINETSKKTTSTQLSAQEQAIVDEANDRDSANLLKLLKQIHGGMPTQAEYNAIERLSGLGLSKAIINVLIYESINKTGDHRLNFNFAETLVDGLKQMDALGSPEQAVVGLKKLNASRKTPVSASQQTYTSPDEKPVISDQDYNEYLKKMGQVANDK